MKQLMLLVLVSLCYNAGAQDPDQRAILMELFDATNGPNWYYNTGWASNNSICGWFGVSCDAQGNVAQIELGGIQLNGTIPSSLGSLSALTYLDLSWNQLSETIPSSLGNLSSLQHLDLSNNQLSGTIPSSLGSLSALNYLNLGGNYLSGTIPPSLGSLSSLNTLLLNSNQLSGTIPLALGSSTTLEILQLYNNSLSGIPTGWKMPRFRIAWDLSGNPFLCPIPQWTKGYGATCIPQSMILMELFDATNGPNWRNNTGWASTSSICGWFGVSCNAQGNVAQILLSNNSLSGTIPSLLGGLWPLQVLDLSSNQLTGLPLELQEPSSLYSCNMSNNSFSCPIPQWTMNNCSATCN